MEFTDLCVGCGDNFSDTYRVEWWRVRAPSGRVTGWTKARIGAFIPAGWGDVVEFAHGDCVE